MLKHLALAGLCLVGAASAAVTPPVLSAVPDCRKPEITPDMKELRLALHISDAGKVESVRVLQSTGDTEKDGMAVACVSAWSYQPATRDGAAVAYDLNLVYHAARIEDMSGAGRAFARLERDADRRCHKLYPVNRNFLTPGRTLSLITIVRTQAGELQMTAGGQAGEEADRKAVACLTDLLKNGDHDDLPKAFSRRIAVDWAHR